ncbi:MAG: flagellar filament capping protein FliD [Verrucomicrobiota bacterium]
MDLGLSGLASGFDWRSLVDQLTEVERAPENRMRTEQSALQARNQAYGSIKTQLLVLQNKAKALSDPELFDSRSAQSGDASIATVTASPGAPAGSYQFSFTQLATAARWNGAGNVGKALNATNDVSALALSDAAFSTAVTAGTLTVNGNQISITATETLQSVFDKIQAASGGAIAASYDAGTDKISLVSASPIVLGSSNDTSNFFQVANLYNNGSGEVISTAGLGGLRLTGNLASANLSTPISDGGSGAGEFKINGVSIAFNSSTDSLQTVLARINSSTAGAVASYDAFNDRITLTNKATGDVGVALQDVTGNFLASTGLAAGTLDRGKNLLYSIDGGEQLISRSNTVTEASSRIPGLSVTALKEQDVTITVASDSDKIKTAIKDFLTEYNKVQSMIDAQTASSTDASGKVTAGLLTGDGDAFGISSKLRSLTNSPISALSTALKTLESIGINSNGNDDTLSLDDEDKLDAALSDNLDAVKALFADSTSGLAVKLSDYLEATAGDDGTLQVKQTNMTNESARIDVQIADYERQVQVERTRLINSFVAMEKAQANINQQLQYLTKQFGG